MLLKGMQTTQRKSGAFPWEVSELELSEEWNDELPAIVVAEHDPMNDHGAIPFLLGLRHPLKSSKLEKQDTSVDEVRVIGKRRLTL